MKINQNNRLLTLFFVLALITVKLEAQEKKYYYFDDNWEITTRSNASYFRIVKLGEKGGYINPIIDYYRDGKVQSIVYSDEYTLNCGGDPIKSCGAKNGKIAFYRKDGTPQRFKRFKDGKIEYVETYNSLGKVDGRSGCLDGNCLNGKGTYVYYPSGDYYVGQFQAGLRHGQGTYYYASSGKNYTGSWVKDKKPIYGNWTTEDVIEGIDLTIKAIQLYRLLKEN